MPNRFVVIPTDVAMHPQVRAAGSQAGWTWFLVASSVTTFATAAEARPRLTGAGRWRAGAWRSLGVSRRGIDAAVAVGLFRWDGDDLVILGMGTRYETAEAEVVPAPPGAAAGAAGAGGSASPGASLGSGPNPGPGMSDAARAQRQAAIQARWAKRREAAPAEAPAGTAADAPAAPPPMADPQAGPQAPAGAANSPEPPAGPSPGDAASDTGRIDGDTESDTGRIGADTESDTGRIGGGIRAVSSPPSPLSLIQTKTKTGTGHTNRTRARRTEWDTEFHTESHTESHTETDTETVSSVSDAVSLSVSPPVSDPAPPDRPDHPPPEPWDIERRARWVTTLRGVGCKIGGQNWPQWKALVDRHGMPAVTSAASRVPICERWPDRTEQALTTQRDQADFEAAIARKTIFIHT